jgi:pentatricopeptide repeat domain-containing protein 1
LLKQGAIQKNFAYVSLILNVADEFSVQPNEQFLKHLYDFDAKCGRIAKSKYHPHLKENKTFRQDYVKFEEQMKNWQRKMGFENLSFEDAVKKVRQHPWAQFKTTQTDGFEVVKNSRVRHKSKFAKMITRKVKISDEEEAIKHNAEISGN